MKYSMKKIFILISFIIGFTLPICSQTVEEIINRIQQKYDTINNLSASFTQIMVSHSFNRQEIERGKVYFKRMGKMRWEYEEPEKKLLVCDGNNIYWYLIEDKQVQLMKLDEWQNEQTPILYLSGYGRLKDDFYMEKFQGLKTLDEGNIQIKLIPKQQETDFQSILMEVNPSRYLIRRMMIVDLLENVTDYIFDDIKENQPLSDKLFTFTIPKGVEVYSMDEEENKKEW